ncbi:MAG: NusA antitermination factor, N utilization substance protein A [candidate division WWE3 bacterium CSP1-7]|uniref:Transcription termination/antitermination protein NusA n=2 Tax=Katanobacteria TaxID=422282 RepID=A0A1F4W6Q7_UNCKA|nr:MAG: NusA antitermination factor, N utilization substance protein A [candidate division WWE3 bacterium CSP1-7]OGC65115.1 MAG: transcription termination factor NusA [candidate division WWE3 bacterium RIFCSPLOWO2_02_FULL_53_10]
MATTEFSAAINQLAAERGVSPESIIEGVKQALAAAYRKDFGGPTPVVEEGEEPKDDIEVKLTLETGEARIFKEGKDVTPAGFGRIAAQTAKQVILQKIREEEKEAIRTEFKEKEKSIVSGFVFRVENGVVFVDLGRTQGILPPSEQIPGEQYRTGARVKALVKEVQEGTRGPEILLSRTDPEFVTELFALEVPEISQGIVKVEAISREAGRRTKIAVSSSEERIDPVGSCVGQKGVRVQAVTHELGEEKVDIIPYSADDATFVSSALSPAKVIEAKLKPKSRTAEVEVPEDQLSLAIGKEGQNVRLAAKLTGWRIDIKGAGTVFAEGTKGLGLVDQGLSARVAKLLGEAGIESVEKLKEKPFEEIKTIKGLGPKALAEVERVIANVQKTAEPKKPKS